MTSQQDYQPGYDPLATPVPDVPAEFIRLSETLPPGIDRKLGYSGDARFVLFFYDPWSDAVAWNDGRSHGFGLDGWETFMQKINPLADIYQVSLGSSNAMGTHVILLDRMKHEAAFADKEQAEAFLAEHRQFLAEE